MHVTDLSEPERRLWMEFSYGTHIDLRTGDDSLDDPAAAGSWGPERQVRAQVIVDLLVGRRPVAGRSGGNGAGDTSGLPDEAEAGRAPAVFLSGARITGSLDLRGVTVVTPVLLIGCALDEPLVIADATCESLRLYGCHLPGVEAAWLASRGDVHMRDCVVPGAVDLTGAHVGGQLVLSGSTITNEGGIAVAADGLVVDGDLYCRDDARIDGEVRMVAARIGGELRFTTATLRNPGGVALRADRAVIEKDLYCREGFAAYGELRLRGAHVKGQANLNRAELHNPGAVALQADQLVVGSHLYCHDHFRAEGVVSLVAARVGGEARFSDSVLSNPGGVALRAERLFVADDLYCRENLVVDGEVNLRGAHVSGQLNFNNATVRNPGGVALRCDELVVGEHLYCQQGFRSEGTVSLVAARVGGEVRFSASQFHNPGGVAIAAPRFAVGGDMYCRERLVVDGEIDLTGAQIGGQLNFNRASLRNEGGVALRANQLVVGTHLYCHDNFEVSGGVTLVAARVGGEVRFSASKLSNPDGVALSAERLFVAQDMYCRENLVVEGTVSLRGAHVAGQVNFNDSTLHGAPDPRDGPRHGEILALDADQLVVGTHLYCQQGFESYGTISLVAARVGGEVRFSASKLHAPGATALRGDRLVVAEDMYCREGLLVEGQVSLNGAHVRGELNFSTATVANPGGVAISAERLNVGGHLRCNEGFTAAGLVDLTDAHVNGEVSFSKALLEAPGAVALLATRLIVDNDMFCRDGFSVTGTVCLIGAHVAGKLSFTSARLAGAVLDETQLKAAGITQTLGGGAQPVEATPPAPPASEEARRRYRLRAARTAAAPERLRPDTPVVNGQNGLALVADGLRVDIDLTCNGDFVALGEIRLKGARVMQNLDFSNAAIENAGGVALTVEDLQADRMLMPAVCRAGRIALRNAKLVELDDKRGVRPDQIDVSGLSYETLIPPLDPKTRLVWMRRADAFEPQPYEQLARSYRRLGYDDHARLVQLAEERHRRETAGALRKAWGYLQDATIGYGYRPFRAAALFGGLVILGTVVFWLWQPEAHAEAAGARLNPFLYTLDLLVPFADFGQRELWNPDYAQMVFGTGIAVAGWILVTAAIAGISRALSRA